MSLLEDKANLIAGDVKGDMPTVVFDPMTIMAIISLIVQVVKLYQECKKTPTQAQEAMASPNWIHRWRLRRMTRQALSENHSDETVGAVVNSTLKQGKALTLDEVTQLYAEADQQEVK
jgi:hypothetical protein